MTKQAINLGTIPNDGQDGDDARTAFTKVNENFNEVYSALGASGGTIGTKLSAIAGMVWAANAVLMATGADSIGTLATGAKGRELMAVATEAAARAALSIGNVDNTSDASKPISTATQTALNAKQNTNAKLTSVSGLAMAANDILLASSTTAFNVLSTGASGRALMAAATAEAVRAHIGLWQPTLPLTANTTADNLTNAGQTYFVQGSTVTEIPLAATGWVHCEAAGDGAGGSRRTIQMYTPYEVIPATGPRRWERSRNDAGVWTNWYRTDIGSLSIEPPIAAGTALQYWRGDKAWRDFATDVRASVLTGLSLATSTAITASDTFLAAMGKLQAQISTNATNIASINTNLQANVRATPLTGFSAATATAVVATDTVLAAIGKLQGQASATVPVSKGGTGGTTQATARAGLGLKGASIVDVVGAVNADVSLSAVIERGENANGHYVRYADGTQACWGVTAGIDQNTANVGTSLNVNLPMPFSGFFATFVNVHTVNVSNTYQGYARAVALSASAITVIQCWSVVQTYAYTYLSIGRWK